MTGLWGLWVCMAAAAQNVSVEAEFERPSVRVGERTTLKVVIRRPEATVVHIEESSAAFAPFELIRKETPQTQRTTGRTIETRRYVVVCF
ncbi:MAG: hypothetical protein RMM53_05755, partial [Bacteroidia bacterium]|nr:hypothetical protein [Bacteroidia bacterium]MDW8333700.1 hypothetical protein [Bacteroidia bacterium]